VVKGSAYGFVVTGTDAAGNYLACTSTGDGTGWLPTGSPGPTTSYASTPTATFGPDDGTSLAGLRWLYTASHPGMTM
jgi:hypothetical protein